jgi:DNA-directed RNA polymerase beta' subunit
MLQLLDIDRFITNNKLKEVKNSKISNLGFDPESLWSVNIFGNPGSRERKNKFAYIQLKATVIHPVVYNMLKTSSESISRILDNKANYRLHNGIYVEDQKSGETGVAFVIKTLPHIDISSICKKEKVEVAQYLEKNKNLILIDKFIVIPAGYRDIDITKRDSVQVSSELNNLYKDVLYINSQLTGDETFDSILINKLQISLIKITDWMQNGLKGKKGVMRGAMLKKRLDYSSRLVLTTNQDIPLGCVGLPWHSALAIYEPLFTNYIYKKNPELLQSIAEYLHKPEVDFNDLLKFIQDVTIHPHIIPDDLKIKLVDAIKLITQDGVVVVKRDPVLSRNSWIAAQPLITEGRVVQLNALDLSPLGGDCDGDALPIIPLFTEEAKAEAKSKMNPRFSKTKWNDTMNNNKIVYNLSLDSAATIYSATKGPL